MQYPSSPLSFMQQQVMHKAFQIDPNWCDTVRTKRQKGCLLLISGWEEDLLLLYLSSFFHCYRPPSASATEGSSSFVDKKPQANRSKCIFARSRHIDDAKCTKKGFLLLYRLISAMIAILAFCWSSEIWINRKEVVGSHATSTTIWQNLIFGTRWRP